MNTISELIKEKKFDEARVAIKDALVSIDPEEKADLLMSLFKNQLAMETALATEYNTLLKEVMESIDEIEILEKMTDEKIQTQPNQE